MEADDYQVRAGRTLLETRDTETVRENLTTLYLCIGLAGESGELIDYFKKVIFHGRPLDRDHAVRELGDILWYVAGICTQLGVSLSDVMRTNDAKLRARYPDGYAQGRSAVRDGEAR